MKKSDNLTSRLESSNYIIKKIILSASIIVKSTHDDLNSIIKKLYIGGCQQNSMEAITDLNIENISSSTLKVPKQIKELINALKQCKKYIPESDKTLIQKTDILLQHVKNEPIDYMKDIFCEYEFLQFISKKIFSIFIDKYRNTISKKDILYLEKLKKVGLKAVSPWYRPKIISDRTKETKEILSIIDSDKFLSLKFKRNNDKVFFTRIEVFKLKIDRSENIFSKDIKIQKTITKSLIKEYIKIKNNDEWYQKYTSKQIFYDNG